jgi:hypothetical protein
MSLRVTRQYVDSLGDGAGKLRATRQYVNAVGSPDGQLRTTREYVNAVGGVIGQIRVSRQFAETLGGAAGAIRVSRQYVDVLAVVEEGISASVTDLLTVSELAECLIEHAGVSTSDTLTLSESVGLGGSIYNRQASDSLSLTEVASATGLSVAVTDSLSLSDLAQMTIDRALSASDTITFAEGVLQHRFVYPTVTDTLSLTDEAICSLAKLAIDTLSLSESAVATIDRMCFASDTLTVVDAIVTYDLVLYKNTSDNLSLSDIADGVVVKERTCDDTLSLSEVADVDVTKFAVDTLSLSELAVATADRPGICSDVITLGEVASLTSVFERNVTESLTLGEVVVSSVERICEASDTLSLSEESIGEHCRAVADTLTLSEDVDVEIIHAVDDVLSLSDVAVASCVRYRHAQDQITTLTESVWPGFQRLDASDSLQTIRTTYDPVTLEPIITYEGLRDEATASVVKFEPKLVEDHLSFAEEATCIRIRADAIAVYATDTISLSDAAYNSIVLDADDTISLTEEATVVPSILTEDELELTDEATCSLVRNLAASDSIELSESLAWYNRLEDCIWVYHPFVGTGAAGAPTPPPETLTGPMPGITAPFQLVYPATGVVTDSVTLCSPNLGNRDQLVFNRILRETRGGTTISFADPIWPKVQTHVLNFSGLTRDEAQDLLDFFTDHLGVEVGMIDWEQRYWRGIIVTPEDPIIEDSFNNYSASFNFEGALDETWSPQAIPWIPGTPLRRIRHDYESLNPAEPEPPEEMPDDAFNAEADSTMLAGTPVYVKSNGHIDAAKADVLPASGAIGLLYADVSAGHTGYYLTEGRVTRTNWTLITGTDLLTPGEMYFISAATAGRLVTTAPTSGYVVRAARATSTQTLDIEVEEPIRL